MTLKRSESNDIPHTLGIKISQYHRKSVSVRIDRRIDRITCHVMYLHLHFRTYRTVNIYLLIVFLFVCPFNCDVASPNRVSMYVSLFHTLSLPHFTHVCSSSLGSTQEDKELRGKLNRKKISPKAKQAAYPVTFVSPPSHLLKEIFVYKPTNIVYDILHAAQ